MQAIREYVTVKNRQIILDLPEIFDGMNVEVIILPGDISAAPSEKKIRRIGILKGKADFRIKADFKMTDEELSGYEISS